MMKNYLPTLLKDRKKAYDAKINKLKKIHEKNGVDKEYTLESTKQTSCRKRNEN